MNPSKIMRSALLGALGCTLALSAAAQNAVADWDANTLNAVVTTAKKGAPVAPVYFAYVAVAMYDAVNSIDHRHKPFAVSVPAARGASLDAAVSAAAHDVLLHYFPAQQATLDG